MDGRANNGVPICPPLAEELYLQRNELARSSFVRILRGPSQASEIRLLPHPSLRDRLELVATVRHGSYRSSERHLPRGQTLNKNHTDTYDTIAEFHVIAPFKWRECPAYYSRPGKENANASTSKTRGSIEA
jgi:hypothetical protein